MLMPVLKEPGFKHSSDIKQQELTSVAWPSGLRCWFKAPVSKEAWVRIPPAANYAFYDAPICSFFDIFFITGPFITTSRKE